MSLPDLAPRLVTNVAATAVPYTTPIDAFAAFDILILGLMLAVGVAIIFVRRLFAVVMLSGVYSLLSAAFFVTVDAVDVAFTEAAVGAGVSTTLMLAAMLLTSREARRPPVGRRWGPFIVCFAVGGALIYGTVDLPAFGDPESPANAYVGRDYLVRTPEDIAVPNVVTAVLASYRGFDTFGEVVVVFTASLGVMLLLGLRNPIDRGREDLARRRRERGPRRARERAARDDDGDIAGGGQP